MNAKSQWAGEFPIAQQEEFRVNRRGFAIACCAAATAGAVGLGAVAASDQQPEWQEFAAGTTEGFEPSSDRIVVHPESGEHILIVRLASGEYRAYDQRCSHLLCPVHYDAEKEKIFCPCHHGLFDPQNGAPAGGPPRKPLPQFGVEVRDGALFISPSPKGDAQS